MKSYLVIDFRDMFMGFPDDEERLLAQDDRSSANRSRSEGTPSFVRRGSQFEWRIDEILEAVIGWERKSGSGV